MQVEVFTKGKSEKQQILTNIWNSTENTFSGCNGIRRQNHKEYQNPIHLEIKAPLNNSWAQIQGSSVKYS